MPPDTPRLLQEFLRDLNDRFMNDVDDVARRFELPRDVALELRRNLQESLRRKMLESDDWWMRDWQEWWRVQRRDYDRLAHDQSRLTDALSGMESRLTERLTDIEDRLDTAGGPCRYNDAGGIAGTATYITVLADLKAGTVAADPKKFKEKLRATSLKARTLVLVDPYALSESNDAGDKGDCVAQIAEIVNTGSIEHLHLYARADAVTSQVWKKLQVKLDKVKMTVHLGDLHDRYLLAGSDNIKGACRFDNVWHGYEYWCGVVFGASLNGVAKRPTYVLPFEVNDVKQISTYLDDHTSVSTLDSQITAEKTREAGAAVQREKANGAGKIEGSSS